MVTKQFQKDEELERDFALGLRGDALAYRRFLTSLERLLIAFFNKRLRDRNSDIDDLVQDTMLAIHNRRHTFCGEVPVTVWLHAIAKHKFIDLLRRGTAHSRIFVDVEVEYATECEALERWQRSRDLALLLKTLPDAQRKAIEAVKLLGLSVKEASISTGLSESAIKVYVHRGMRWLAAQQGKESHGPSPA